MNSFVLRIPYPKDKREKAKWTKNYGLNAYYSGKHWAIRKKDADFWHDLVAVEMRNQHENIKMFDKPVTISYKFNDRLDCSNHAAMAKMIEDALKGVVIEDDNAKCVVGMEMYFHNEDYIEVEVRAND